MPILLKYLINAALITIISEIARRSDRVGAFIAAMPWVTVLVMVWLFVEKAGDEKIASHAWYTFWYVLPTMPMFLLLPWMLRKGQHFGVALGSGVALTLICFGLLGLLLKRFEIYLW